ncbi:MAG: hypothetical protein PHH75_04815 [Candidatus Omnitrophica bacterium]|nr:hypothetical protein [Candidatus Omnitrophota bacterium]MDD5574483.1 hypothetical protein [Candidatus Omnitrophota bacterium]
MVAVNVVIVHGIGNTRAGYSDGLQEGLRREFSRHVRKVLGRKVDTTGALNVCEVVWEDVLAENEGKLKAIFEAELKKRRQRDSKTLLKDIGLIILVFVLFGLIFENPFVIILLGVGLLALFSQLLYKLRTAFAAESVCDIVAYHNKVNYRQIHNRLQEGIDRLRAGSAARGITFIAHSLGTVIASDYVYDAQEGLNNRSKDFRCANIFTLGSPLALFALQYGPEGFQKPITIEEENGRWVNILDVDDPIGYKLKLLNDAYDRAVLKDQEVNTGLFGFSHLKYWDNRIVHRTIAAKLAIDWLGQNGFLEEDKRAQLYRAYDEDLR